MLRRYQRSGPNTASFKQKSFRLDLSSPQEEPLSPRESSTKKSPKEKGIKSEKSSTVGTPTQKIDFSQMSSTKYGSPKVADDGKRASLSKATPSKSLERNRTPHKSSSAKIRDILRTPAALSTKSEATRTPLSGRSKQTRGKFPPTELMSNQLGHLLDPPAYIKLKEQDIFNFYGSWSASFNSRKTKLESLFRFSSSMHNGASRKICKINNRPVLNMIVELKIWRDCSRNDDD